MTTPENGMELGHPGQPCDPKLPLQMEMKLEDNRCCDPKEGVVRECSVLGVPPLGYWCRIRSSRMKVKGLAAADTAVAFNGVRQM